MTLDIREDTPDFFRQCRPFMAGGSLRVFLKNQEMMNA
jgi:hypothetical protein